MCPCQNAPSSSTLHTEFMSLCQLKLQKFIGLCVMYWILIPNIWSILRSTWFISPRKVKSFSEAKCRTSCMSSPVKVSWKNPNITSSNFKDLNVLKKLFQMLLIFWDICANISHYMACFFQRLLTSCPWPLNVSGWNRTRWMYVCLDISLMFSVHVCFW